MTRDQLIDELASQIRDEVETDRELTEKDVTALEDRLGFSDLDEIIAAAEPEPEEDDETA